MNIIESTDFFLRVTMFDFINRSNKVKLKFRILPMFHIGTEKYYQQIFDELNKCDEVIYEGIDFKRTRWVPKNHQSTAQKLGLVRQREYLKMEDVKSKLIHADYTPETGQKAWRDLRLFEKIKLSICAPIYFYFINRNLTRRKLAKKYMTRNVELNLAYALEKM